MAIKIYERFVKPGEKTGRLGFNLPELDRDRFILDCRDLSISPSQALRLLVKSANKKSLKEAIKTYGAKQ